MDKRRNPLDRNLNESGWIGPNAQVWEKIKSIESDFFQPRTNLPDNILKEKRRFLQSNILWSDDTLLHENGYEKLSLLTAYYKDSWVILRIYSEAFNLSYEYTGTYPAYRINFPISFDDYIKHMHCAYPKSETGDETIHIISDRVVAFGSSTKWAMYSDRRNSEVECILTSDTLVAKELISKSLAKNMRNADDYGYCWDDEKRLRFWEKIRDEYA